MSDLANPLIGNSGELTYDFSDFDLDMDDLYDQNARRGGSTHAVWDEEAGQYYLATVEPHSEMDLLLSGQTIEDITSVDYSEPVYFVGAGSHELGEVSRQWDVQDSGTVNMSEGWMTESQLREQWNADEGMGYFKKANPDMTFDSYMDMVRDGTSRYQAAGGVMAGEQESFLAQLAADHGVKTTWQNSDGDVFNFTGSGYAKTFKVDDHLSPGDYMKTAMSAAVGIVAGPALASSLTATLGAAGAKAASSAIINMATQLVTTGELDWKQALISAATSYGGAKLGEAMAGAGDLDGIVGKIADAGDVVKSKVDSMLEFVSQGNSIAEAAIKAGGMSMLTQLVSSGEVNLEQAAVAALLAAGSEGFSEWKASMDAMGADADEYMADLAESDEFRQAAIDADIKDPFLNPNYETVGDGVIVNTNTGIVYGVTNGEELGNMADLDSDGDGMLSGNDLQEVDVTATPVDETLPRDPDSYFDVDGDGQYTEGVDTDLTAPPNTTNPDAFTNEWADERYAGLSGDQIVDQMQRDGFTDEQINSYMEHWNATNDLNLQELNTTDYGAITVNSEDKYTIGQTDEGTYYIAKVDDNGEVAFTAISQEQYDELYGRMYGGPDTGAGAIVTGDYSGVDGYLDEQGIGSAGDTVEGTDPFNGMGDYEDQDGWITLVEGADDNSAVQVDFTEDTPPEEATNDADATGDPNDSTDAGQGGGVSEDTGGESGDAGIIGGGGTIGGGDTAAGGADGIGGDDTGLGVDVDFPVTVPPESPSAPEGGGEDQDGTVGGGTGGDTAGGDTAAGTGGDDGGDSSGAGGGDGVDAGEGTGTGNSDHSIGGSTGTGSGDSGHSIGGSTGSGSGTGGGAGGGSGNTVGGGTGTAPGTGSGAGGGGFGGDGEGDGGMLSGSHDNVWGELFAYTTLTPYQKEAMRPYVDYIEKARGMLS